MFFKTAAFKNLAIFTGKHLCWSFFLIKSQTWRPAILLKKSPTQVLSCEYCEIFKNSFFIEHFWWQLLFHSFLANIPLYSDAFHYSEAIETYENTSTKWVKYFLSTPCIIWRWYVLSSKLKKRQVQLPSMAWENDSHLLFQAFNWFL